jgi:hypothetical protein
MERGIGRGKREGERWTESEMGRGERWGEMGREWAERGMGREMRGERGRKMKRGAAGEEGG